MKIWEDSFFERKTEGYSDFDLLRTLIPFANSVPQQETVIRAFEELQFASLTPTFGRSGWFDIAQLR